MGNPQGKENLGRSYPFTGSLVLGDDLNESIQLVHVEEVYNKEVDEFAYENNRLPNQDEAADIYRMALQIVDEATQSRRRPRSPFSRINYNFFPD